MLCKTDGNHVNGQTIKTLNVLSQRRNISTMISRKHELKRTLKGLASKTEQKQALAGILF